MAALIGTAFSVMLLVLTAMYAGPFWRDEAATFNLAHMPSLRDIWHNLRFESCPLLWPLLVRGCGVLGLIDSDMGIRILGLGVGLFFLTSLWLCQRWFGGRAPTLSIALLGGLPALIFVVGANRAYGLAGCLLVLSFGTIWRVLESPSQSRILSAGFICLLFVQCIYYGVIFLGAMLAAGALIAIRRKRWKVAWAMAGIGLVAGASFFIYLPVMHQGSEFLSFWSSPFFEAATLWTGLGNALATWSSANPDAPYGSQIWIWIGLSLAGAIVAVIMQRPPVRQTPNAEVASTDRQRSDLALFCVTSVVLGTIGYTGFLLKVQYFMQPWHYVEILVLWAVSLDGILTASWPALRPWGLVRIGFLLGMMILNAGPAWAEAHTRRSNLDLVAAFLSQNASARDLIVVQDVLVAMGVGGGDQPALVVVLVADGAVPQRVVDLQQVVLAVVDEGVDRVQDAGVGRGEDAALPGGGAAAGPAPGRQHHIAGQVLRRAAQAVVQPRPHARPAEGGHAGIHH